MKYNQISDVLNGTIATTVGGQVVGNGIIGEEVGVTTTAVATDLSNIVDVGKTVLDYTGENNDNFNKFVSGLIDRIGRVKYVDRTYQGTAPNILHDSWEYASIMMKTRVDVPAPIKTSSHRLAEFAANKNASGYNGIGQNPDLDPFILNPPGATAKFYNEKDTYTVPITIAEKQLKTAFTSAGEMARFISMIENRIATMRTVTTDALIRRTIANLALTAAQVTGHPQVINLVTLYNASHTGSTVTAANALSNGDFLRYASSVMTMYKEYIKDLSNKYNDGTYLTFTPNENLKFITLTDFDAALKANLYSDVYHDEYVKLQGYETVRYWQYNGDNTAERATIVGIPAEGTLTTTMGGVVGIMFDEQAAAVCNEDDRVTSQWNPRGEYFNYFYMWDASYMNDTAENCIIFVLADPTTASE